MYLNLIEYERVVEVFQFRRFNGASVFMYITCTCRLASIEIPDGQYAEIFIVLKFLWVPSTTKIKPSKILPPRIIRALSPPIVSLCRESLCSSAFSHKPAFLKQQRGICRCKHGIHVRIATQQPSFHRANCQGGKFS